MGVIFTYFRQHPWQRRVLTTLLTICLAAGIGAWYLPRWQDQKLLDQLRTGADAGTRAEAEDLLILRYRKRSGSADRIRAALDSPDDEQFRSVASILRRVGDWDSVGPAYKSRRVLLVLEKSLQPMGEEPSDRLRGTKLWLLASPEVDRLDAARLASRDADPLIRKWAAVFLTQQARDDASGSIAPPQALESLCGDPDPGVRGLAILGRGTVDEADLDAAKKGYLTAEEKDRAGWAELLGCLMLATDQEYDQCRAIVRFATKHPAPDLLSHVAWAACSVQYKDDSSSWEQLQEFRISSAKDLLDAAGENPPAEVLALARRADLDNAVPIAEHIVHAAATDPGELTEAQAIAAMELLADHLADGDRIAPAALADANAIIPLYWDPPRPGLLTAAIRLLGTALVGRPDELAAAGLDGDDVLATIRRAAIWRPAKPTRTGPVDALGIPAGEAAIWQWLAEPSFVEFEGAKDELSIPPASMPAGAELLSMRRTSYMYLRQAMLRDDPLAADHITWRLGVDLHRLVKPSAVKGLGKAMLLGTPLPEIDAPMSETDPRVRSAGAMLVALRTQRNVWKDDVPEIGTFQEYIRRERPFQPEFAKQSYTCALRIYGVLDFSSEIDRWVRKPTPIQRRALEASVAPSLSGGEDILRMILEGKEELVRRTPTGAKRLLLAPEQSTDDLLNLLVARRGGDVFRTYAPNLPTPWLISNRQAQIWQLWTMRIAIAAEKYHAQDLSLPLSSNLVYE